MASSTLNTAKVPEEFRAALEIGQPAIFWEFDDFQCRLRCCEVFRETDLRSNTFRLELNCGVHTEQDSRTRQLPKSAMHADG